ncbi:MAG: hypothetical protein C5B58_16425 [Acidobacteria bacterium]|nr:MAG: hypothetical protein C5B58_16425 [Acidobacteriota bacterium]
MSWGCAHEVLNIIAGKGFAGGERIAVLGAGVMGLTAAALLRQTAFLKPVVLILYPSKQLISSHQRRICFILVPSKLVFGRMHSAVFAHYTEAFKMRARHSMEIVRSPSIACTCRSSAQNTSSAWPACDGGRIADQSGCAPNLRQCDGVAPATFENFGRVRRDGQFCNCLVSCIFLLRLT